MWKQQIHEPLHKKKYALTPQEGKSLWAAIEIEIEIDFQWKDWLSMKTAWMAAGI